ncbi:secondary thiamine-phosphate synthase enzyme YjbQ [Mesonia sp.]|uniref:secondary thiamine-phosphate synthase enzyme YjbQ n=1 Tax=Mesonia sp. TaxID=1960830 RepID=UPI00176F2E95|nr:secondary thiamine-phosphate synthase enzyme YjbQ [Mesonia sp.]HIB36777.1 YjbQ family protein [Mesonia sp.]HIO26237.1 YjbQ family protein [Flavobacteriaceae bacterium]
MKVIQKEIRLQPKSRGFHLITSEIEAELHELKEISAGILKVFMKHTSAGLTVNENADPTVRDDFESHINKLVPENMPYYKHTYEGADDMPAHIKSSLMGSSVEIPVTNGCLNLGTWQGIYLGEFRNHGGARKLVLTLMGE